MYKVVREVKRTVRKSKSCQTENSNQSEKTDIKLNLRGLSGTRTKCWLVNVLPSGCFG